MPRVLHLRLLVWLTALLLPAGALLLAASLRGARSYHQEIVQRQNLELARNLVEDGDGIVLGDGAAEVPPDLVKMLAMANPGVEIYLLDRDFRVVQAPPGTELATDVIRSEPIVRFQAALDGATARFPILGTDPQRGGTVVFSAAAVADQSGWLYVVLTDASRASLARTVQGSTTLRLLALGGGLGLAVLLASGAVSFTWLTRRMRRLADDVRAFRLDAPSAAAIPPPTKRRDEIDDVRQGFAELAERAREQYHALQAADRRRRELVTNVSHDLRTPLTALTGYLEALDEVEPEQARAYLASARRSAERLRRLIDQLFELSRLEGHDEPLHVERFPVTELVSDVVQKFGLHAERNDVDLATTLAFPSGASAPFVRGDLGAIERALSNVLENALRHTPPGGSVDVTVEGTEGHVRIAVLDTGPGIPDEHLPHVFDRFYRIEEGRSGEGSGLGLAIAHRVVELHGGTIRAERRPGGGTRVAFTLPVAAT